MRPKMNRVESSLTGLFKEVILHAWQSLKQYPCRPDRWLQAVEAHPLVCSSLSKPATFIVGIQTTCHDILDNDHWIAYSQKGLTLGQDAALSSGRLSWLHGVYILELTKQAYIQLIGMSFTIIHTSLGGARKSEILVSGRLEKFGHYLAQGWPIQISMM